MAKVRYLLLCILLVGCSPITDKEQNTQVATSIDTVVKSSIVSNIDAHKTENEIATETDSSEITVKKLQDVIINGKDRKTFDTLMNIVSQQYEKADFRIKIADTLMETTVTDSIMLDSLFNLFTESNADFMNQYSPLLGVGSDDNFIYVSIHLYGIDNEYDLSLKLSACPNLSFYDESDTYLIAYAPDTYDIFMDFFSFMIESVTLYGPSEVTPYDEQLLSIDENAPLFLDTNDLFYELEAGGDLILHQYQANPMDKSLIGVLNTFLYEQGQSKSINTKLHMFVEKQSENDGLKTLDVLLYYTDLYLTDDEPLIMLYDKEMNLLKHSELDIYDGISWGEVLSKNREQFYQYQLTIRDIGDDIHEFIQATCLNCTPITKLNPNLPYVNVYQNVKSYDTKYKYTNNITEAIPQFNVSGIQAYDCNQKIIQMKGKVYGYKLIEEDDKIILQAINRITENKIQNGGFFYYVASEYVLDTKTLEVKQTR